METTTKNQNRVHISAGALSMTPQAPRGWWVSCDEAGTDGESKYYGFGSLWMLESKRGEFLRLVRAVRARHGLKDEGEFKWTKVSRHKEAFYRDLVDTFFATNWLNFHCIVVRKAWVQRGGRSLEDAMMVHLHHFIVNKVARCADRHGRRPQRFRFWFDPLPHRYRKAGEALQTIANHSLQKLQGERLIDVLMEKDSKEAPSIQLCDLLLGAVVDAWNARSTATPKTGLATHIAEHLGWSNLRAPTFAGAWKFNAWYLQDPNAREEPARRMKYQWEVRNVRGRGGRE